MKKEGYYSSGQFAGMAHVTLRTIRYYDKQGILKPSFVNESGARFYTDEDFARLQQILLLKYLGFSLDDIREMIVDTKDLHYMQNSLNIQLNLVRDRIEQMQLVEKAILETSDAINKQHSIDWSRMLNLIHLTGMEESLKKQYQNASNISARINLHRLYSQNKQGWFPWILENCHLAPGMNILETFRPLAGCGLFPSGRCLRHGLSGVSVPLRGVGCFTGKGQHLRINNQVSVPLRGVGCFEWLMGFPTGWRFPSPCGVWVVSSEIELILIALGFRPLAGCGSFPERK